MPACLRDGHRWCGDGCLLPAPSTAVGLLARSATERPRPTRLPFTPVPMKSGCRVFAATVSVQRNMLGERVSEFLADLRAVTGEVERCDVVQSSDRGFHCLSIVVWYAVPVGVPL